VRRVAAALGRALITIGVLVLLFAAYQLWGTGIYTSRQQSDLRQQFASSLKKAPPATTHAAEPSPPPPPTGDALARIRIPKIGLDNIVVNGIGVDDLRKGPGHYPFSSLPGQQGNSAIAGHRTTYGAPFGNLDQLSNGDVVLLRTVQGSFTYRVYAQLVVDPSNVSVLNPDPNRPATLTLTTCNPKYSAAQRLVIKAALGGPALPPSRGLPPASKLAEAGLSGDSGSLLPTLLSGLVVAVIGGLWWLGFHRHARWTTWFLGAVPFFAVLFVFYYYLERVLPANY
jgi:sortase A